MFDPSSLNLAQLESCSEAVLLGFIKRADRILDNETNHPADYRAGVAVFRSILIGVLDARVATK